MVVGATQSLLIPSNTFYIVYLFGVLLIEFYTNLGLSHKFAPSNWDNVVHLRNIYNCITIFSDPYVPRTTTITGYGSPSLDSKHTLISELRSEVSH